MSTLLAPRRLAWPGVQPMPDFSEDEPIVGLSLMQPNAAAIIDGPKRVENRPWPVPKTRAGRAFWLAIHASAKWYTGGDAIVAEWRGPGGAWQGAPALRSDYPTRCIVGLARVVGCATYDEGARLGRWAFGPHCLLLDHVVVALPEPIPYTGSLSLWAIDDADVHGRLVEARRNPALRSAA